MTEKNTPTIAEWLLQQPARVLLAACAENATRRTGEIVHQPYTDGNARLMMARQYIQFVDGSVLVGDHSVGYPVHGWALHDGPIPAHIKPSNDTYCDNKGKDYPPGYPGAPVKPRAPETLTEAAQRIQALAADGSKSDTAAERIRNAAQSTLHAIAGDAVRAYRDLAIVNGRLHKTQTSLASAKPDLMALLSDLTYGRMNHGTQMAQASAALQALEDALGQIGEAIAIIENPMQTKEGE